MPLVKVEIRQGFPAYLKQHLLNEIHQALVTAFKIPDSDRTQRLIEHAPDCFEVPPGRSPRFTLVEITAFAGRSLAAKRSLYREIVERLGALGIAPSDVLIVLNEVPLENWGLRGGVAGCDLDLGFKVTV